MPLLNLLASSYGKLIVFLVLLALIGFNSALTRTKDKQSVVEALTEEASVVQTAIAPFADVYVHKGADLSNRNFAQEKRLVTAENAHTYLQFNLTRIEGDVDNAAVLLNIVSGSMGVVEVYHLQNDQLNEPSVTWNTRPLGAETLIGTLDVTEGIESMLLPVRDVVKQVYAGDKLLTLVLKLSGSGEVIFDSSEASDTSLHPMLYVDEVLQTALEEDEGDALSEEEVEAYSLVQKRGRKVDETDSPAVDGNASDSSFAVAANGETHPPIIQTTPKTTIELGQTFEYELVATDLDLDPLKYSLRSYSDVDMTMTTETGGPFSVAKLDWTPTAVGNYDFTVYAEDPHGGVSAQDFTINVLHASKLLITSDAQPILTQSENGYYYHQIKVQSDGNDFAAENVDFFIEDLLNDAGTAIPRGDVLLDGSRIKIENPGIYYFKIRAEKLVNNRKVEASQECAVIVSSKPPVEVIAQVFTLKNTERFLVGGGLSPLFDLVDRYSLMLPWDNALRNDPNFNTITTNPIDRIALRKHILNHTHFGKLPLVELVKSTENNPPLSVRINNRQVSLERSGNTLIVDDHRVLAGQQSTKGNLYILQNLLVPLESSPSLPRNIQIDTRDLENVQTLSTNYENFGSMPVSTGVDALGNFICTLPIDVPHGVNGMTPHVALSYNSSIVTDTVLGHGWRLNATSRIERRTLNNIVDGEHTLDIYDENSGFSLDGQPLREVTLEHDGKKYDCYATDEDIHARIQYVLGTDTWQVFHKNGVVDNYGPGLVGRREAKGSDDPNAWFLDFSEDYLLNQISYKYDAPSTDDSTLDSILYGDNKNLKIHFEYVEVADTQKRTQFRHGLTYQPNSHRLTTISVMILEDGNWVTHRQYKMGYDLPTAVSAIPRTLTSVTIYGKGGEQSGQVLDTHTFEYNQQDEGFAEGDDGRYNDESDFMPVYGTQYFTMKQQILNMEGVDFSNANTHWVDVGVRWLDVDNDGRLDLIKHLREKGVVTNAVGGSYEKNVTNLKFNDGDGFSVESTDIQLPVALVKNKLKGRSDFPVVNAGSHIGATSLESSKLSAELIDINGDGLQDVVNHNGDVYINQGDPSSSSSTETTDMWSLNTGYHIPDVTEHWYHHRTALGPSHKFIDLDGDMLKDIIVTIPKPFQVPEPKVTVVKLNERVKLHLKIYKNNGEGWTQTFSKVLYHTSANSDDYYQADDVLLMNVLHSYYLRQIEKDETFADDFFFLPGSISNPKANASFPNGLLIDVNADGHMDYIHDEIKDSGFNIKDDGAWIEYFSRSIFIGNGNGGIKRWEDDDGRPIKIPKRLSKYNKVHAFPIAVSRFHDLNNDGYPDLVYADKSDPDNKAVYMGTGSGWQLSTEYSNTVFLHCDSSNGLELGVRYLDLNADGLKDMIQSFEALVDSSITASQQTRYRINLGSGFGPIIEAGDSQFAYQMDDPLMYDVRPSLFRTLENDAYNIAEGMVDPGQILVSELTTRFSQVGGEFGEVMLAGLDPIFIGVMIAQIVDSVRIGRIFQTRGTGQSLIDIDGNGTPDDVLIRGNYDWDEQSVTDLRVRLNKRSSTYNKLNRVTNNLHEITVEYEPLTAPGVLISKKSPRPGGYTEGLLSNTIPLPVVTSITQDVGGTDRTTDYYYGDYMVQPGKGYTFGKRWSVDNIARSMIEKQYNTDHSWFTFGRLDSIYSFKYDPGLADIERDDSDSYAPLINSVGYTESKKSYEKDDFATVSYMTLEPKVWQPYLTGIKSHFAADHTPIFEGYILDDYTPYFIMNKSVSATVDPETNKAISIRTVEHPSPTRFGAVTEVTTTLEVANIPTRNASMLTRDNPVNYETLAWGPARRSTVETSYSYFAVATVWLMDRVTDVKTTVNNGLETKVSNRSYEYTSKMALLPTLSMPERVIDWGGKISKNHGQATKYAYYNDGNVKETITGKASDIPANATKSSVQNVEARGTTYTYATSGALAARALLGHTTWGNWNSWVSGSSFVSGEHTYSYAEHNPFTGQPGQTTDPNGLVSTVVFDAYDHVKATVHPAPSGQNPLWTSVQVIKNNDSSNNIAYVVKTNSNDEMYHYTAHDNVGRVLKSLWPGFHWDGTLASGNTYGYNADWTQVIRNYNTDGTLDKISKPISASNWSTEFDIQPGETKIAYTYDEYNRLRTVAHRGTTAATYDYESNKVSITDAVGSKTTTTNFGVGLATISHDVDDNGKDVERLVLELHGVHGKPLAIRTDADGDNILEKDTAIFMQYDTFGNRKQLDDPSFGFIRYSMNPFNEVFLTQKNLSSIDYTIIRRLFDYLGRIRLERYNGKRQNIRQPVRYETYTYDSYDDDTFYGFLYNQKLEIERLDLNFRKATHYEQTLTPDAWGSVIATETVILDDADDDNIVDLGETYTFQSAQTYDSLRRLETRTPPYHVPISTLEGAEDEENYVLTYGYSHNHHLNSIIDSQGVILWSAEDVDHEGFLKVEAMGENGLPNGDRIVITHTPDASHRLMNTLGQRIRDDEILETYLTADYRYYNDNTMQSRTFDFSNTTEPQENSSDRTTETFSYDPLKQLTGVRHQFLSFTHDLVYQYDDHSRMKSKDFLKLNSGGSGLSVQQAIKGTYHFTYPDID